VHTHLTNAEVFMGNNLVANSLIMLGSLVGASAIILAVI